jgi:hypothetical protein
MSGFSLMSRLQQSRLTVLDAIFSVVRATLSPTSS